MIYYCSLPVTGSPSCLRVSHPTMLVPHSLLAAAAFVFALRFCVEVVIIGCPPGVCIYAARPQRRLNDGRALQRAPVSTHCRLCVAAHMRLFGRHARSSADT